MLRRTASIIGATAITALLLTGAAGTVSGATGSSGPTSTNGNPVKLVASGVMTPTAFAFGDNAVFEGDGGNSTGLPNGGLFVLAGGKATKVATPLIFVAGLKFHAGVLYASGATMGSKGPQFQILTFKGWNGTKFANDKAIYTAPSGFQGFNGIGFGPNGTLYVGVDVGLLNGNDHGPASTSPYLYDILRMSPSGTNVSVFAKGIRQPWQMAFPAGSSSPFVTVLGQDSGASNPPDFLLRVKGGQNYGFPACNWTNAANCAGDAKPTKEFAPHTDPGGIAIVNGTIYLSEFGFAAPLRLPKVVSLPSSGTGTPHTVVDNFPSGDTVIGLAAEGSTVYFGVIPAKGSGLVYSVKV